MGEVKLDHIQYLMGEIDAINLLRSEYNQLKSRGKEHKFIERLDTLLEVIYDEYYSSVEIHKKDNIETIDEDENMNKDSI